MRKEIKILRDDNNNLKAQIEKMKIFVPVSLFSTDEQTSITDKGSWELAAKVMSKGSKVRISQKIKYLEDCVKEVIQRHKALRNNVLKAFESKWKEYESFDEKIDLLHARIEGYLDEIENSKITS